MGQKVNKEVKMNTVEPIREVRKVMAIRSFLKDSNPRDYLLFVLGINLALRIGDLLSLKVKDVLDEKGEIVDYVYLREQKTKKEKRVKLNKAAKEALDFYFRQPMVAKSIVTDLDDYLFTSRRSGLPLDRIRVYQMIRKWTEIVGLRGRFGTHTLRKTWGYMARTKQAVPIEIIQQKLGHSSPEVTRRYIGITQDEVNDIEEKVCL